MFQRIYALILKELLTLFRDPKSRVVLIAPPLLQLLIFSFAATLEVKNVTLGIYDLDYGRHSTEIEQRLQASPTFSHLYFLKSEHEIKQAIDTQQVMAVLSFPKDFSRKIEAGEPASLELLLDGRKSNATQIINGYISQIVQSYQAEIYQETQVRQASPLSFDIQNWFNRNLEYLWFTVPSLIALLSGLIALMITALSVARERELGTFDQLLVSPLSSVEILIGKTVPAILVGFGEGAIIFAAAIGLFGVPFQGNVFYLALSELVFITSIVGVGLFISSLAKTQQQAILGGFIFLVPAITLSGYASPVENMPNWLQKCVEIDPFKHYLIIVKGVFLKDIPFIDVWQNLWPMLVIACGTLIFASWMFKSRLE